MEFVGEYEIEAEPRRVWSCLLDEEVLRATIPGCKSLEGSVADGFAAEVVVKLGPVKAMFKGEVSFSEIDEPHSLVMSGDGKGGVAGFAHGSARVNLAPTEGGGTLLSYVAEATVGGKIAQIGSRLITASAKKIADKFFENFRAHVAPASADSSDG